MCCRQKWSKVLTTTFSVAAALGGLLVICFCFNLILNTDNILGDSDVAVSDKSVEEARTTSITPVGVSPLADSKRQNKGLNEISKRVSIVAFCVGISAVIFGLAGICVAKIKKCPCTFVFGFIALILTAAYGFCSFLILSLYYVTDEQLKDFCDDNLNLDGVEGLTKKMIEEVEDYVYTVDKELKRAVDTHMCTDFCPCEGGWDYAKYGTFLGLQFADHENNDYNFSGTQNIFTDCYNERKSIWPQQDPSYEPIDTEVINLVKTLEADYDCSGICGHATFWASKDIKTGPPQQACIYKLKDAFDDDTVLIGWSIVVTGVMTFFLLMCHCGLYLNRSTGPKKEAKKRFIFD